MGNGFLFSVEFLYSTEIVAFLLGVLIWFLVYSNAPKRTKQFKRCFVGMNFLMLKLILEMILEFYVNCSTPINEVVVNVLTLFMWSAHILMVGILVIYMTRMSDLHFDFKKVNTIILSYVAVVMIIGIQHLLRGTLYYIDDAGFHIYYLFAYIESVSFIFILILFAFTVRFRAHYPRPLFRYMAICVPVLMGFEIVQMIHHEIVFSGIIYMIPYVIFFFLYHNDAYDQKTGGRSRGSLDGYLESMYKRDRDFIMLFLQSDSNNYEVNRLGNAVFEVFWKFCRLCEYLDKDVSLFNLNNKTIILISSRDVKRRHMVRDKIEEYYFEYLGKYLDAIVPSMFVFEKNEYTRRSYDIENMVDFLAADMPKEKKITWNEIDQDAIERYGRVSEIRKMLRNLAEQQDLDNHNVVCYAQPIFNVKLQKYTTAEALIRIRMIGEERFIAPVDIIPIAEQIGCIHTLTMIMINKVCKFLYEHGDDCDLDAISVNCSVVELQNAEFFSDVQNIIVQNGVSPSKIRLEITESTAYADQMNEIVLDNIKRLSEFGIEFYLDDYGTGYSNLARLLSMNFNTIKFDKSLLYRGIADDSTLSLIDSMVTLFKGKDSRVLVEGVETKEQLDMVIEHGFEYVQGFYFSEPVPIEQLAEYFAKNQNEI